MRREKIGKLLLKIHRKEKILCSEYLADGNTPIVDQSSDSMIVGYTDNPEARHESPLPITLFGDHTRVVKFIDFPFACGADGTQLLYPSTNEIDPTYFYYTVKNVDLSNYFYARHFKFLKEEEIPIFDNTTQKHIAGILKNYDELIKNNLRRMNLLEDTTRLFYKEWFVDLHFPGHEHIRVDKGVPEGWNKVTAFDAMDVLSGGTPKTSITDYWGGEIPFYTPKDSIEFCYVLDTEKHLTEVGLENCNSNLYPKDTIFITARGTVGNLNLAQRPMAMNQSCYALVGKEGILQKYLFCAMRDAVVHLQQNASGAVFDAIIVDTFKRIPFIVPEPKIVNSFESTVEPMFKQVENLLLQNQRLKIARDILLPRLMNGEIQV